jgi:hypothetical protein
MLVDVGAAPVNEMELLSIRDWRDNGFMALGILEGVSGAGGFKRSEMRLQFLDHRLRS